MNIGAKKNQEKGEELLMNFGVAWNGCWTSPGTCSRWRSFVSRQFVWRTTWQAEWWRVIGRVRLESGCTPPNKHGTWKWTLGKGDSYWKPSFPGSMLYRMMCLIFKSPLVLEWYFERSNCNVKRVNLKRSKYTWSLLNVFPWGLRKVKDGKAKNISKLDIVDAESGVTWRLFFRVFFEPLKRTLKI